MSPVCSLPSSSRPLRITTILLTAASAWLLAACSDQPPTVAGPAATRAPELQLAKAAAAKSARARHEAEELRALVDSEPDFGGFYFDSTGDVQILLVGDGRSNTVVGKVRSLLVRHGVDLNNVDRNGRRRSAVARVLRTQRAQFSFAKLTAWRDSVGDALLDLDAVTSVDVDDIQNRLSVGLARLSDSASVRALLNDNGVPAAATLLHVAPIGRLVADTAHLDSRLRPLAGGSVIRSTASDGTTGGPGQCSLGVPGYYNGRAVVFTAAHCTFAQNLVDNGRLQQPQYDGPLGVKVGFDSFGTEIYDQATYTCGTLFDRGPCRQADVAAYDVSGGVSVYPGETGFLAGRIAYPEYLRAGNNVGYHVVNGVGYTGTPVDMQPYYLRSDLPYMHVVSMQTHPQPGQVVFKVGRRTGFTFGTIYATCQDHKVRNEFNNFEQRNICMDDADLGANPGDSGSPVFVFANNGDGSAVIFLGIISAEEGSRYGGTQFSSVRQISQEIGYGTWTAVGP